MSNLKAVVIIALLTAGGVWQLSEGGYIYAKAQLAQHLIKSSWQQSISNVQQVKPWPWADTWPVARLTVPRLTVDQIVLAGDNGRTLAFGPGHRFGTVAPGDVGNSLIAGHRDTHFQFLRALRSGDEIFVQTQSGVTRRYLVYWAEVIDESTPVNITTDRRELTLVTCYPFDTIVPGGPLRYVVFAEESQEKVSRHGAEINHI